MKFPNKTVIQKAVAVGLVLCLLLVVGVGAAAEDGPEKPGGFVLFGLGALRDGTEEVRGGIGKLIEGNEKMADGLSLIGTGLDVLVGGGLDQLRSGVDQKIVPGLDGIYHALDDIVVPGLRKLKSSLDGDIVGGLDQIIGGINKDIIDGLDTMRGVLTGPVTTGLNDLKAGIQDAEAMLGDLNAAIIGDPDDMLYDFATIPPVPPIATFGRIKGYMFDFEAYPDMSSPTSLYYDIALVGALSAGLPTGLWDGGWIELPVVVAGDLVAFATAPIGHAGDGTVIASGMVVTGADPADWIPIDEAVGYHVGVKQAFIQGALAKLEYGLGVTAAGGIDKLQAEAVAGLVGGIDRLKAGLSGKIVPGLNDLRKGLAGDFSKGLGDLIGGFTMTEATHGTSGILEGLALLRAGLSSTDPAAPGVSQGLGQVTAAVRGDILDGVHAVRDGLVESATPGLKTMDEAIRGELQPGFSKVSLLLIGVWAVTLVIFLVIGLLIGRAGGKARAARSASM